MMRVYVFVFLKLYVLLSKENKLDKKAYFNKVYLKKKIFFYPLRRRSRIRLNAMKMFFFPRLMRCKCYANLEVKLLHQTPFVEVEDGWLAQHSSD